MELCWRNGVNTIWKQVIAVIDKSTYLGIVDGIVLGIVLGI
jgi:hypothetical protein